MRIATIITDNGVVPALVEERGVLALPDFAIGGVKSLIARHDVRADVAMLRERARSADWKPAEGVSWGLPVPDPGKILCIGLNYRDHAAEGGHDIPNYPAVFMRTPASLVPHRASLVLPRASDRFDYEAELVIVIGRRGRHIEESNALEHVFGYTLLNDGSLRDYQRKSGQWTVGKNFDGSGSMGPVIVSADELPAAASDLRVTCSVNGELLQNGNTAEMIFPVARIVSLLSEVMTLEPGDIIATGTPAGVGFARKPPLWLKPGDRCVVEIEGIGRLENDVVAES